MFDEQPDGDPHGECAAEIARLNADNSRLREALEHIQFAAMDITVERSALSLVARDAIASNQPEQDEVVTSLRGENEKLRAAILEGARRAEALKRDCGMDPESPISLQNSRYMGVSYFLRAALATPTQGG